MADETPSSLQPPAPASQDSQPPTMPTVTKSDSPSITQKDEIPAPPPETPDAQDSDSKVTEESSPAPAATAESRSLASMMQRDGSASPPLTTTEAEESEVAEKSSTSKEEVVVAEVVKDKEEEKQIQEKKIPQTLISFKEESNKVSDLLDVERNALLELKQLVQDALNAHQFTSPPPPPPPPEQQEKQEVQTTQENPEVEAESDVSTELTPPAPKEEEESKAQEQEIPKKETLEEAPKVTIPAEEVSIWGIPLLKDDRSDVILLKFLRARDFKVRDAFVMLKNTIKWRKEFDIDTLLDEDLGDDLDKVVFMHEHDREGHPVCYNVYGEFQNKGLYQNTFSDEEKRNKFLRWRIQFLERSIRKLDFRPGGINTIFQVNDLKNSPGPGKRELRIATKQALQLLQDNYPEFVAKQVFVNVPWWYIAFYTMISPFMTQRTKSKFVFAGPAKSAETLFKYISPEQVPIQYGGLSVDYCDCNPEFTVADAATEITLKPATKHTVEIVIYEKCVIVWELRVIGWEVSYGAEFAPDAKDQYTVVIRKRTKMAPTHEPVVNSCFKVDELGKLLLTIDNPTTKKKKLIYRFNVKPYFE
ncbi:patellin-3 [Tripterygium wilfordii]|uniref:Patellin-3 n=1 Tax=Tripterygium wilfordii TaxID=458696 RepID=A0A7J7CBJ2_TRIWF|nr:patellin-3-like [Tripterygium wilfordii]KAF5731554.1 patellin-3 [Tripterygium wilfordii]